MRPDDFVRPGHINPLRARAGGVLVRTGQTEGSVDLARLAGLHPSAVIIEIVGADGSMARGPELEAIAVEPSESPVISGGEPDVEGEAVRGAVLDHGTWFPDQRVLT